MTAHIRSWARNLAGSASTSSLRGGAVALVDQLTASAANLLTGVIIGRVCTQDEFGLYMLGFTIVTVALQLQISLISTPYLVHVHACTGKSLVAYTGSTLLHQVAVSATTVVALLVGGAVISLGFGPPNLAPVIGALACAVSFILLREYVRHLCFAHLEFSTALMLDLSTAVIQIGALLLVAYNGLLSPQLAFLLVGMSCCITASMWILRNRRSFQFSVESVGQDLRKNWILGRWVVASTLLWQSSTNIYPWLLAFFHGTSATGIWGACIGAIGVSNPITIAMQNYVGPRIAHVRSHHGPRAVHLLVRKSTILFTLLVLPFSVILLSFGGWIIVLLYGPKYAGYHLVVAILAVNLLLLPLQAVLSRALVAIEHPNLEFSTNIFSLFFLVVLGWWFVRDFGPVGAAAATLASGLASNGVRYVLYRTAMRKLYDSCQ